MVKVEHGNGMDPPCGAGGTYGFDRNSNRKYRENTKAGGGANKDERYYYDGLDRLTTFHRGKLDGSNDIPSSSGDTSLN